MLLEIKTRPFWAERWASAFKGFSGTRFVTEDMAIEEYRRWLQEADACLIAYNFDMLSRAYVQYSLANKLPEVLASGAKVIAIGPEDFATIDAASKVPGVSVVTSRDQIGAEVRALVERQSQWADDGRKSRQASFSLYSLEERRAQLAEVLCEAAKARALHSEPEPDGADQATIPGSLRAAELSADCSIFTEGDEVCCRSWPCCWRRCLF